MKTVLTCVIIGLIAAGAIVACDSLVIACMIGAIFGLIAGIALFDMQVERDLCRRENEAVLNLRTWWP